MRSPPPRLGTASLGEIIAALRAGAVTAVPLLQDAADNQAHLDGALNAYRVWNGAGAERQAIAADAAFRAGVDVSMLQGVPVAIKDVFGVAGLDTYGGTPMPWPEQWNREGAAVRTLRNQLAVFAGKTHTVEFAFGTLGTNPHWGAPRNPWDLHDHRVCGGSSSGSGVALLEGTCALALASDAGGSIRVPASFTGTAGIKTTHNRWPIDGPPLAPTQTCAGILARDVADLAIGFATIDPLLTDRGEFLRDCRRQTVAGLRIGVPRDVFWDDCWPGIVDAIRVALAEVEAHGAILVDINLPETAEAIDIGRLGAMSIPEGHALINIDFADWAQRIEPNIKERISGFGAISTAEFLRRHRRMRAMEVSVDQRLQDADVDVVAWPTTAISAVRLTDLQTLDGFKLHNEAVGRNAYPPNLWNLASLSLPAGLDPDGLPIGLMLSARAGHDANLMIAASAVERVIGNGRQRLGKPPMIA